jgi:hypothetical protein
MPRCNKTDLTRVMTCGQCGRYGHNRRGCSDFNRENPTPIAKVGIEIEGFWLDLQDAKNRAYAITGKYGCSDGSVTLTDPDYDEPYENETPPGLRGWEFQTKPDTAPSAVFQLHSLYPDWTNPSCGMHVHISFKESAREADMSLISGDAFYAFFRSKWEEWGLRMGIPNKHQFWKRLRGENNYCMVNRESDSNGFDNPRDRYCQLNFCSWNEHRTIECRLLPMFRDSKLAVAAVYYLCEIFEEWLLFRVNSFLPDVVLNPIEGLDRSLEGLELVEVLDEPEPEILGDVPVYLEEVLVDTQDPAEQWPASPNADWVETSQWENFIRGDRTLTVTMDAPEYPPPAPGTVRLTRAQLRSDLYGGTPATRAILEMASAPPTPEPPPPPPQRYSSWNDIPHDEFEASLQRMYRLGDE